ncbi:MAG: DUF2325 domain-containing protein [Hyphomicrobiaceae bacterium]|nr:MAG: DUF2325 domain-containing protein [Hyphomicrobiaceae bacterium]
MHGKLAPPGPHAPDIADYLSKMLPRPSSRRLALWEIEGGTRCSIIGTCLSDHDLLTAIHKNEVQLDRRARSYDIHSHCVRAAGQCSPLSRTLTKMLDRRFAGAIRLIGRCETDGEMGSIWKRLCDNGQIAAGYWAIMSHTHVPDSIKVRVFGEVHMLSHLNGHDANQLALRLAEADRKNADLEARLRRCEQAKRDALAERDAARAALAATAASSSVTLRRAAFSVKGADGRLQHKLAKCERALLSARARARHAEETIGRMTARPLQPRRPTAKETRLPDRNAPSPIPAPLPLRRILYLGGRTSVVPHLREAAAARKAAFLHHDGGIEDGLHRIEEMIEGCDAVICPVDCISHGACRMAKAACQRLNKRFLPIATASRSGFERALDELSRQATVTRLSADHSRGHVW